MVTAKIPFLVPMRPDGGRRDQLWRYCKKYWAENAPELDIFEGLHLTGPFNRGEAINIASDLAGDWDVAVVGDSDVIADPAQLRAAVENSRATGRVTLAYDHYTALREEMTDQILAGYNGNWADRRSIELEMKTHVSSLVVVPRKLWDTIGGFNPKLASWGYDDTVFAHAARVIGGGVDRVPGVVYHLWHMRSPETKRANPRLLANHEIAKRYFGIWNPSDMLELVEEQKIDNGVTLVVLTHGRRDCIIKTIPSAEQNLKGLPIARRIISDDSGNVEYQAWLRVTFPDYDLVCHGKPGGFAANVIRGRTAAIASGHPWVFWLEDDFTFNRPVDLNEMATALTDNPKIVQMALRRQAWFPVEVAAGGVVERFPDKYVDKENWLEHRLFFTTNPHLVSREFLILNDWPKTNGSEAAFSRKVLTQGVSGYWGKRTDEPWVNHFGERTGTGY